MGLAAAWWRVTEIREREGQAFCKGGQQTGSGGVSLQRVRNPTLSREAGLGAWFSRTAPGMDG